MTRTLSTSRALIDAYIAKILNTFGSSIVGYWKDPSTGIDYSGRAHNGVPTAITSAPGIGDGGNAGNFDGTTSVLNLFSAGLAADFNPLAGTQMIWGAVSGAGIWADGLSQRLFMLQADASNRVYLENTATANQIQMRYSAGGVSKSVTDISLAGTLNWFHLAFTWSVAADQVKAYINGAQVGATQTGLGTWVGSLVDTVCNIGASVTTPTLVWSGRLAHGLLLNRAATAAEVLAAATVP